jgi:DNA polymerase-3 subunit gamma/tau
MSQALYRKWRPKTWDEVLGQEHVVTTLRNAVRGDRVGHAYLFAGPRGTGKTTTARLLAKAVNCLDSDSAARPCNRCAHCEAVNDGRFLDLIEIDAASNTSVDDMRDLRDRINFSPNQGRCKVYIIDEVHMLSTAAFNALLKTLEEPPSHAVFILATTEVHRIPPTILSRCQRHEFRRIPLSRIIAYLKEQSEREGLAVEQDAIESIARHATGSLRDAISLLDQLTATGETVDARMAADVLGTASQTSVSEIVEAIAVGDVGAGLATIQQSLDEGVDPGHLARQIVEYLRGLMMVRLGNAALVDAPSEVRAEMAQRAQSLSLPALTQAIKAFSRPASERRPSLWQPGLALELALIESAAQAPAADPASSMSVSAPERPAASSAPATRKASNVAAVQPPEAEPASTGGVEFAWIRAHWRDVLAAVSDLDRRTQALLNSGRPMGLERGALVIGFASDLLREKMEKGHNLALVRQGLESITQQPLAVRCVLMQAWAPEEDASRPPVTMEDGGMVATALRDLGGQIVDVKQVPPEG